MSNSCYDEPGWGEIAVGILLILGIFVSYAFQIYRIVKNRSVEGVNYLTIWLALQSASMTFINTMIEDWSSVQCVKHLNVLQALGELLPLFQVVVGPMSLFVLYAIICAYTFWEARRALPTAPLNEEPKTVPAMILLKTAGTVIVGLVGTLSLVVLLGVALVLLIVFPSSSSWHPVHLYADGLGIAASLIIAVVWLPQIFTTFWNKSAGSLSIEMLILQMPGSLLVVLFQAVLANPPLPWSTWLPYIITAFEQLILIILWVYYTFRARILARWRGGSVSDSVLLTNELDTAHIPLNSAPDDSTLDFVP